MNADVKDFLRFFLSNTDLRASVFKTVLSVYAQRAFYDCKNNNTPQNDPITVGPYKLAHTAERRRPSSSPPTWHLTISGHIRHIGILLRLLSSLRAWSYVTFFESFRLTYWTVFEIFKLFFNKSYKSQFGA